MGKKGNSRSVYSALAASNHSNTEREENDFYATPEIATKLLIEALDSHSINIDKTKHIYEPCCGKGHIAKEIADAGYDVIGSDLVIREQIGNNYKYIKESINFFNIDKMDDDCAGIITNPPYGMCTEFTEHALNMMENGQYLIELLKIQFLEGKKRFSMFKQNPPKYVFVFSTRINCAKGGEFGEGEGKGGAACFAWYVWEKGYKGLPMIDWLTYDETSK